MKSVLVGGNPHRSGWVPVLAAFAIASLGSVSAFGQCTLSSATSWNVLSGNWGTAANWNPAAVPNNAATNVCLTNGSMGTPATTALDISPAIASLQVGANNTLNTSGTILSVGGPSILNAGAINLNGAGGFAYLALNGGNVSVSGGGSLTLGGGGSLIYNSTNTHQILENVDNKIVGAGNIGDSGGGYNMSLTNDTSGTVNANVTGQALLLSLGGGVTNTGTLEASNGGILQLNETVTNVGGTISTDGNVNSVVQLLNGAVIQNGTLNGNIQTVAGNTTAVIDPIVVPLNNKGSITVVNGSQLTMSGAINNTGSIILSGTGSSFDYLSIAGPAASTTTLSGGGTLTLQGGAGTVIYNAGNQNQILENVNNKIQGAGQIGDAAAGYNLSLTNDTAGIVNANVMGGTLILDTSSVTNTGLLEATGGGILQINTTVNNNGGTISTDGTSLVNLNSATIEGGTLNGNVHVIAASTLDGATQGTLNNAGTLTVNNGTSATILGTINNTGSIVLAGPSGNTYLAVGGAAGTTTTLKGGGTLTMQSTASLIYNATNLNQTLENVDNKIQGVGQIGDANAGYNLGLKNDIGGLVNANVNGGTLVLNTAGAIGTTNFGTLEATNGGILQISTTVFNNPGATLAGGLISADATSQVNLSGATIEGGTLSGNIHVTAASTLDGASQGVLNNTGTLTVNNGLTGTIMEGTINNTGQIVLAGTGLNNTYLVIGGSSMSTTTLMGGGTLTLQGGTGTLIYNATNVNQLLENVDNKIQGAGQIGDANAGYNLGLKNDVGGTVNANVSGGTLILNTGGALGTTNFGTLEATGGGILQISTTVYNNSGATAAGGLITTDGTSLVNLNGATIQGGTLNGNVHITGTSTLDGISQGALNNVGTITIKDGIQTNLTGTLNNTGSIVVGPGGGSTVLNIATDTTFRGGGTITLGAGTLVYNPNNVNQVLENFDNTIKGAGQIGDAAVGYNMTLKNDAGGTIFANASGQTLTIDAPLTNNGTLQVAAGSTMHVEAALTNFAGGTLTGGTYDVAGNLKIDVLGSTGGEILSNASTIVLDGPTAEITDSANQNALSAFQDNLAAGSFTVENGQQFVTTADGMNFENDGTMRVGGDSSFTAATSYIQRGGSTQVDGTLTATGGDVNIDRGTLSGTGTIVANVTIGDFGTLSPGDSPGTIHITGNYTQFGTLDEEIAGTPGSGKFDVTDITGAASLSGTLDISLLNGFMPTANNTYSYVILDAAAGVFGTFGTVNFLNEPTGDTFHLDYSNPDEVILDINGPLSNTMAPEPTFFLSVGGMFAVLAGMKVRGRRRTAATT